MKKVLFVCLGNICRSPAAEAIFHYKVNEAKLNKHFYIDSAGTINNHEGKQADKRMFTYGLLRGFNLKSISRPIQFKDIEEFDIIIAMDKKNHHDVRAMMSEAQYYKLHLMSEFSDIKGFIEVPDPYYGKTEAFDLAFNLLENACDGLLKKLRLPEMS
jgi:protein-tyrosine phosphatase